MDSSEQRAERSRQVEQILADYYRSVNAGTAPSVEVLAARYPDLSSEIREQLGRSPTAPAPDKTQQWDQGSGSSRGPDEATHVFVDGSSAAGSGAGGADAPSIGTTLGDYRLTRRLGQGGMGVVYEAEHGESGRTVALKLLSPDLPRTNDTIARFLNEASLAAGFSHPRTTFIYEAGETDGHFFITMELMPGGTLRDEVESRGRLPVNQAVDYILDVLEGLEAAHQSGVVHRDVKPSNCFLDEQGRVKVGDFGLSKSLVAESDLTRTGTFLGTPQFAAPEQFRRAEIDHRTDVFAVGATLYFLLAGQAPFQGDAAAVIAQIVADDAPLLHMVNPDVPRSLSRVVERSMRKDAKQRFADAKEFRRALLPHSTHGTSIADLGRRVAALFVDSLVLGMIVAFVSAMFTLVLAVQSPGTNEYMGFSSTSLIIAAVWIPYFAICEGLFGCTLAKFWLRLRVVDNYGERPGIWRSLVRALILPGITWAIVDIFQYRYNLALFSSSETQAIAQITVWNSVIVPQMFQLAKGGLSLVICSSMRARNGYRGWHELLSGTRVLRLTTEDAASSQLFLAHYSPERTANMPATIGSFRVLGQMGRSNAADVYAVVDQKLDRPAWVYVGDEASDLSAARIRAARPTRQRWLRSGHVEGTTWVAMEAVDGIPLSAAARYSDLSWAVGRRVLLETAEEIQAAVREGTLPECIVVDQIWIDNNGRVKLLDAPLQGTREIQNPLATPAGGESPSEVVDSSKDRRLHRQLCEVVDLCTEDEETPGSALDLAEHIKSSPTGLSLEGVTDRLRDLARQPYRFRWDDRLGVLAISGGVETVLYGTTAFAASMALASQTQISKVGCVALATLTALTLPAILAYLTRGGVVFWFTNTEVRTSGRVAASPGRCAWRSVIAWLPIVAGQSMLGLWISDATSILDNGRFSSVEATLEWIVVGLYLAIFGLIQLSGFVMAIVQPRRGFQDLIARTYLVRR